MTADPFNPTDAPFDEDAVHGRRPDATADGGSRRVLWGRRRRDQGPSVDPVEQALIAHVRTPLHRSRRVVVASRKGGVGKTTVSVMLGHTFAALRTDRVVVIDGDPDGGTLAHRVHREDDRHIGDLLDRMRDVHGYTAIREHTVHTPTGLEVLTTSADPTATRSYHDAEYLRVINKLNGAYGVIVTDTGTGVLDNVTAGLLENADQLVLVARAGMDEAWAAASTLDWLIEQGSHQLVSDAVVVLNAAWPGAQPDLAPIRAHFQARCRAVAELPFDDHLELGAVTDPARLGAPTRRALLEIAAAVGQGFPLVSARAARREAERTGNGWSVGERPDPPA